MVNEIRELRIVHSARLTVKKLPNELNTGDGMNLNSRIASVFFLFAFLFVTPTTGQVVYLDQGWDEQQREDFYFTPQGSQLVPYS